MNRDRFLAQRNLFGLSNRAFLLAATVVVGICCIWGTTFKNTTKVDAAQPEFQGGATPEMLAFALNFKNASDFAVFAGRGIRNRGESTFRGRVGAVGSMEGVPSQDANQVNYGQAKQDMQDALRAIAQLPCADDSETQLGGRTFTPGVYCLSSANLAGTMVLDGSGDSNSRFIFRVAGAFSTAADSRLNLVGGAVATNVYIIADDNIIVGNGSNLKANLISKINVTLGFNSDVSAKTIGVNGDIDIDTSSIGGGTGVIEICKNLAPGDPIPVGTIFGFDVSGVAQPVAVPAGACSAPFEVAAGNVTVSEISRANTAVISIVTNPPDRRVSFSLALRQVVVAVPEGDVTNQTVVTFTNQTTRTGTIEICKRGLDPDVTGFFQFTAQGAPGLIGSVPVGFCSGPITLTILQVPGTPFTANVTELAKPNFRLENVTTLPASRFISFTPNLGFDSAGNPIVNINGGFATVTLISGGGPNQQTTINFFNRSLPGVVKVCKITADPIRIPLGTLFRFTVMGTAPTSPTTTMPGVPVTRTVDVPAGPVAQNGFCQFVEGTFIVGTPVTVVETGLTPGQTLPGGLTFADVRVSRIRSSTAVSFDLATKTATFAARNTTAEVEFTNYIFRPAILKICKIAGPGIPVGSIFNFTLAAVDPLTTLPINPGPIPIPAGSCQFANGPFPSDPEFPGIGTFNFGTQIIVTEAAVAGTVVQAITSPTGGPIVADLPNRRGTILLNQSLLPGLLFNEIAFTNAAGVPPPGDVTPRFDFDGDGLSDPVIFRPASGTWWYAASSASGQGRATQFGLATDKLVAADYDGDGTTDFAVYRSGVWHILGSTRGYSAEPFGLGSDIPQPGDYDGDHKADLVVFRPSDGKWYMQLSQDGFRVSHFGLSTDTPVAGDYDGDARMDPAVYRGGTWYVLGSAVGFKAIQFGLAGDLPIAADYDGDGKTDTAVYRSGVWHILRTNTGYTAFPFGAGGDIPVPADYDGDGRTDAAVFRPSSNVWHLLRSSQSETGGGYMAFPFGASGDMLLNY